MLQFQIDDTYSVPGVGTVVSGTNLKGTIRLNDNLLLGPDPLGQFIPIAVKSIHRKRMPVSEVKSGQTASFALKKIKRSQIRKGMVMVSPRLNPAACWEFSADIMVLHHPTTISVRYQAMVHCGPIRQTASIMNMNADCLRTGDKADCHFKSVQLLPLPITLFEIFIFCPKIQLLFPEKIVEFFWGEKLAKMLWFWTF